MEKELLFMCTHCDLHSKTGAASFIVKGITRERDKANFFFYLSGSTLIVIDSNNDINAITNQYLIENRDVLKFTNP